MATKDVLPQYKAPDWASPRMGTPSGMFFHPLSRLIAGSYWAVAVVPTRYSLTRQVAGRPFMPMP